MRRNQAALRPRLESLEERYCLASSVGWDGVGRGSATLTYFIGNAPSSLSQAAVNAAIKTALNAWSAVVRIKFTQTTVPNQLRSLDITFRPIDGAGGTLAQAYLPADVNPARIAGDVRFDSSERWEIGNAQGRAAMDLVQVAVHEIGHALGLEHSSAAGSVMASSASATQSFSALSPSDVTAIRSLYASTGPMTARSASVAARSTTTPHLKVTETINEIPTAAPAWPFLKLHTPRFWRPRHSVIARG